MHVLYITQYYTTEDQAGGIKHYRHVKNLLSRGHRVTVVTSYVTHTARTVPEQYRGRSIVAESHGDLTLYKTYAYPGYGNDLVSRGRNYVSFMCHAFVAGLRPKNVDLVLAYSPPLPLGLVGWSLAKLRRARFVFEAGDVWPDALIALGAVRNRFLIGALRWLEMFIYRRADKVVLYSPRARRDLEKKGVSPTRLFTATLGVDVDPTTPAALRSRDRFRLDDADFVAIYVGAHGVTNSLRVILEAAASLLKKHKDIWFTFIGDGEERASLMESARREQLVNVTFKPPVSKKSILRELREADVGLWVRYRHPYFEYMLPNKVFDYLEACIPVIVAGAGDTADLVTTARCGLVVPTNDPLALAEAVLWMHGNRREAREMGRRGREYVRKHYDREEILTRYSEVLEELVHG